MGLESFAVAIAYPCSTCQCLNAFLSHLWLDDDVADVLDAVLELPVDGGDAEDLDAGAQQLAPLLALARVRLRQRAPRHERQQHLRLRYRHRPGNLDDEK